MDYLFTHQTQAKRDVVTIWNTVGIVSPEQQDFLFAGALPFLMTPFPSRAAYGNAISILNGAQPSGITLAYAAFMVPRFITTAALELHVNPRRL
jgi:hypothetical protein